MLQSIGSQRVRHDLATEQQKQPKMMVGDSFYTNPISPRLEPQLEKNKLQKNSSPKTVKFLGKRDFLTLLFS